MKSVPRAQGTLLLFYYSEASFPVSAFQGAVIHLCEVTQGEKKKNSHCSVGTESRIGVGMGGGVYFLSKRTGWDLCMADFQSSGHRRVHFCSITFIKNWFWIFALHFFFHIIVFHIIVFSGLHPLYLHFGTGGNMPHWESGALGSLSALWIIRHVTRS